MSINDFLKKTNVQLLWEVIIDDDLIKKQSNEILQQISNTFEQNIRGFNDKEKNKLPNLISMNKKFIGLIMNQANNIISQSQKENKKDLITSSDLQSERITIFEKELSQKQMEFSNAMNLSIPPVPKFSDDNLDKPINEMELEIKKVLEQRKYDVDQLSKTLNNSNSDTWLKPQETSIKNEKLTPLFNKNNSNSNSNNFNTNTNSNSNSNNFNTNTNNSLKYIKIDKENIENTIIKKDIIDLGPKKHISWQDHNTEDENINLIINEKEEDILFENNIFKKLKKITPEINEISVNNRLNILENKIEGINNNINLILQLLQNK